MPKLVPTVSVVVIRKGDDGKGKRVKPPLGKPFDFTAEEVADIRRLAPAGLRKPVNESTDETEGHTSDDSEAGKKASSPTAPEGNKKATANKGTKPKAKAAATEREATGQEGGGAEDDEDTDENEDEDGGDDETTSEDEDI